MISKLKLILLCPVPEDQKPITEYLNLKDNSFTNWSTLELKKYNQKIFITFFICLFIFSIFSYSPSQDLIKWFLSNLLITINTLIFVQISVIFRWNELKKQLKQSKLFYEEGSWYDSQVWEKPFIILKNDRLLVSQKLIPILRRLYRTLTFLCYIDLVLFILQ